MVKTKIKCTEGIPENVLKNLLKSIVITLQKDGYQVKTNLYPKKILGKIPIKFGKYYPDIFAFRGINNILVIEFETCTLSTETEIKWKVLASKSCTDLHVIVPCCCKEKVNKICRIKKIPVTVHCTNDCPDSLKLAMKNSK